MERRKVTFKLYPNAREAERLTGWVRLHDYNELLRAYRGALCQLDRAAKRVATMMPNSEVQGRR